jgi:tmRNA-binding protein
MSDASKLTEEEKQNGRRKLLIPSKEIQALMEPISEEDFAALIDRATLPSPQPDSGTH